MCFDITIEHLDAEKKWVWGAGFGPMWDRVPDLPPPTESVQPTLLPSFDNKYLCLTICGYRKPGMDEVDYRNHMVNVSAPLTKELMVKYRIRRRTQIHNQSATRAMMAQLFDNHMINLADFDCFSQVFFESLDDYKRMKQDPWFKEHVSNDHTSFADTKRSMYVVIQNMDIIECKANDYVGWPLGGFTSTCGMEKSWMASSDLGSSILPRKNLGFFSPFSCCSDFSESSAFPEKTTPRIVSMLLNASFEECLVVLMPRSLVLYELPSDRCLMRW